MVCNIISKDVVFRTCRLLDCSSLMAYLLPGKIPFVLGLLVVGGGQTCRAGAKATPYHNVEEHRDRHSEASHAVCHRSLPDSLSFASSHSKSTIDSPNRFSKCSISIRFCRSRSSNILL